MLILFLIVQIVKNVVLVELNIVKIVLKNVKFVKMMYVCFVLLLIMNMEILKYVLIALKIIEKISNNINDKFLS